MTETLTRLQRALADRYRLDRELGAGGMATVYLAHDLKHDRDVAIKVLHPDLGAALGGERFLTEIRTTARLQHPHILPLLDSGDADGLLYYVMPLVTGETLRARLDRERQLPIADAVRIAREVASALDYAHRQNVIHRDIKPENILLHDGSALVADFGIALAVQTAGGQRMTQTGLSLGTPNYMSPEQAMGERTIDARSDLYALGAVTYEMLVGEAPFTGPSVQAIIARVLTEEPRAISVQRKAVPAGVEDAVLRALEKLPADRFESAKEFIDALGREGQPTTSRATNATARAKSSRGPLIVAAVLAIVAGVAGFGWWRASHASTASNRVPLQFRIDEPDGAQIIASYASIGVSSVGRRVAFIARDSAGVSRAYVRNFDDVRAHRLEGTEGVRQLFLSPDGAWVAFANNGKLMKVPAAGGNVEFLADIRNPRDGQWATDGHIYLGDAGRIVVVPENGGAVKTLRPLVQTGRLSQSPRLLDDGTTLLFTDWGGNVGSSRLMSYSLSSDSVAPLGVSGSRVLGVNHGLLIYGNERGAIYGVAYDAKRRVVSGEPRLMNQVAASDLDILVAVMTADGSLLYRFGENKSALTMFSPGGAVDVLSDGLESAAEPRLSPDGTRIALTRGRVPEVLTYDLRARSMTRFSDAASSPMLFGRPEWTPDGTRLVMREQAGSERSTLVWRAANGTGGTEVLHRDANISLWEGVISPDAQYLMYRAGSGSTADLRYRRLVGDTASRPFVATPAGEETPRFAPDGRWVIYASDEAGTGLEVYVRAFPDGAVAYRISESGGQQPVWSRDGKSAYYIPRDGVLVRARLDVTSAVRVVTRDTLVRGGFDLPPFRGHANFDVMADGRLVLFRPMENSQRLVLAHGWLDAVRAEWATAAK
ncbi:MAG: protein kinase [Gemmatimonadaceae bacterium]|nr:protein kinase [Gemmatimonadaceae bacterium]